MMYEILGLQALHFNNNCYDIQHDVYIYIRNYLQMILHSSLLLCMVNIGCLAIFFPTITKLKLTFAFSGD